MQKKVQSKVTKLRNVSTKSRKYLPLASINKVVTEKLRYKSTKRYRYTSTHINGTSIPFHFSPYTDRLT